MSAPGAIAVGQTGSVADGVTVRGWLVDPAAGREGAGEVVVRDGRLNTVRWLAGDDADGLGPDGVLVAPGFVDLHAHFREPGNEDAETVATYPSDASAPSVSDRSSACSMRGRPSAPA